MKKYSEAYIKKMLEITPKEKEEFDIEFQKSLYHHNWMVENGYVYCTPTSPSIMTLHEHGFNPIGIISHFLEETLIFRTKKEADSAYKKMERDLGLISGW